MTDEPTEIPLFANAMNMIQAEKAMENIARLVTIFQKSLVKEGFSGAAALELCNTWLDAATRQARREQ